MEDLQELRHQIDGLDRQILTLLNERYKVVKKVGEWKLARNQPVYVPEREKMLLEKLESLNPGPMSSDTLRAIYREIMSGSMKIELPLRIAYLGPEATYTHLAARSVFGHGVEYDPRSSIKDVFHDVETGRCNYGVVPVENSTEGVVNYTLDILIDSSVHIISEINMDIRHCLPGRGRAEELKMIYSHAQSLEQCRNWLDLHLPGVERVPVVSNARACQLAQAEPGAGAIAGILASEVYGLTVIERDIQDNPDNATRFLVMGRQEPDATGNDKTSIVFSIKDKVGGLQECLRCFSDAGVSLSMIESRPLKKRNWEYIFFVDIAGHKNDGPVREAMEKLAGMCLFFKVLGSYPRAGQRE
ncbi:MAG: prephenate dehydratase [Lentisphaeria bacterium]|nr:prephenate dehydratase [Lentisphaeria bacterium]